MHKRDSLPHDNPPGRTPPPIHAIPQHPMVALIILASYPFQAALVLTKVFLLQYPLACVASTKSTLRDLAHPSTIALISRRLSLERNGPIQHSAGAMDLVALLILLLRRPHSAFRWCHGSCGTTHSPSSTAPIQHSAGAMGLVALLILLLRRPFSAFLRRPHSAFRWCPGSCGTSHW